MANNQRHKDLIEEGIKEFRGAQTLFLFAKEQHDKFCKTSLIVKEYLCKVIEDNLYCFFFKFSVFK